MAQEDLIPLNKRTKTEQKRITRMGGIASGKARRQKKTLAQIGDMIGGLAIKSDGTKKLLREAGIEDEDMINDVAMMYRLNLKAKTGDPRAIELLSKLRGQFTEHIETTVLEPPVPLSPRKKKE